jgi:hypothetical protein
MRLALLLLLLLVGGVSGELKIAILMQGSDFINVTIVPTFDVNQFDLGDVFISPCRAGTYNEARDSYCKDCSVCADYQYQSVDCVATHNRVCLNCSVCTDREQEICACRQVSQECATGNRVCLPLPPTTANITFDLTVSAQLSALKERFLLEGLRTGFVLFLSGFLQHNSDDILVLSMTKRTPRIYFVTILVANMYSLFTKSQVSRLDQATVQEGLTSTFGVQSNTFSAVSQQARRRLLAVVELFVGDVEKRCTTDTSGACSRFFVLTISPDNPCNSQCNPLPCPPGYTGLLGICDICPNATYKPIEGNETCTPSPPGASSNQGSANATECWVPTTPAPTTTAGPTTSGPHATTSAVAGTGLQQTSAVPTVTSARQQSLGVATSTTTAITTARVQSSAPAIPSTTAPPPTQPPGPPPASTPGPPPSGSGGSGGSGGISFFNLTVINNYFFAPPEWNAGHAGVVQYITINEERDRHAVTMVSVLMVAGLLAIGAIGARLFLRVRGGQLQYYTRIPTTEPSKRRKEIPLPILVPPPPEPAKQSKKPPAPVEPPKQAPVEPRDEPLVPLQDLVHFPGITALLSREPPEEEDDSDEYY